MMAIHIRDAETDTLVRRLAAQTGGGITDTIKLAVSNELERRREGMTLTERVKPIQDRIARWPIRPQTMTDKEFSDWMCEDD